MRTTFPRVVFLVALLALVSGISLATPRAMGDHELDAVYAAGFNVRVDIDLGVAASNPDALVFMPGGDSAGFGQFVSRGLDIAKSGRSRAPGSFDPSGTYMPNLQNLTMQNITLGENALRDANTLLNVFALNGDVAVGINMNVIVNPINSNINLSQVNLNWSTLNTCGIPGS